MFTRIVLDLEIFRKLNRVRRRQRVGNERPEAFLSSQRTEDGRACEQSISQYADQGERARKQR